MTSKRREKILLIEHNPADADLLRGMLSQSGSHTADLTHVSCMSEAEKHLAEHTVDIILLDPELPDSQGLETVRRTRAAASKIPVVILTSLDKEEMAAQAVQCGAQDYLIKDQIERRGLLRAIHYALASNSIEQERKRLVRLRDQFVATVSHELRTPLTSICGSIALLMTRGGELPDLAARLLPIAHRNGQRLTRLVDDLLDIDKIESGEVIFRFRCVDVRTLAEEVIQANRGS